MMWERGGDIGKIDSTDQVGRHRNTELAEERAGHEDEDGAVGEGGKGYGTAEGKYAEVGIEDNLTAVIGMAVLGGLDEREVERVGGGMGVLIASHRATDSCGRARRHATC